MIFSKRLPYGNVSPIYAAVFGCLALAGLLLTQFFISNAARAEEAGTLKIALVHYEVKYKDPEHNLRQLVTLNRKAAQEGASLILNTEMAVSGYSFGSRRDVAPFTETDQGETIKAMGKLAKEFGVYIGITFPECDPSTQSYYNGAFVLDPQGRLICKYHKIFAERRWARPGNPLQEGVFDTPWGRMGVAICADSYNGLIPRTMALKGVDFLWVPANWPPMGGLDPKIVWSARALENGFYLAACNRTGKDRIMDCRQAISCVFDPKGNLLFSGSSERSQVFLVEIPLDANGRLSDDQRRMRLNGREIDLYRQIYLEPWIENLTGFYQLPETGILDVHCFVPASDRIGLGELEERITQTPGARPALWILPEIHANEVKKEDLAEIARKHQLAFAVSLKKAGEKPAHWLITPRDIQAFTDPDAAEAQAFPFKILHYGPAAIAMVPIEAFRHPELAVVMSKLGSDLVVLSEERLSPEDLLLSRIKALTGVAVAACASNGAEITCVKDLHGSWDQRQQLQPGVCAYRLDTSKTRKKSFQARIDFDLLLESDRKGVPRHDISGAAPSNRWRQLTQ